MRRVSMAALACGLLVLPADAFAFWRAGGVTPGGTAWRAGGAGGAAWGGAYRPGGAYHGYVGGYAARPYPAAAWRGPVAVAPYYAPAAGAFAAGALVGAAVGAGTAANSVATYGQPSTVINNYYQ